MFGEYCFSLFLGVISDLSNTVPLCQSWCWLWSKTPQQNESRMVHLDRIAGSPGSHSLIVLGGKLEPPAVLLYLTEKADWNQMLPTTLFPVLCFPCFP